MRFTTLFGLALGLGLGLFFTPCRAAPPPPIQRVTIRQNILEVNGKPFFPIGIYHAAHYHKGLPQSSAKGFNTAQVYGSTPDALRKDLDDAYENGMYGAVALNGLCEDLTRLQKIVEACRDHPGLLVWALEDEPNLRTKREGKDEFRLPPERLRPAFDLIKRLDPNHPIWLNLAYGMKADYKAYASACQILSADIYPVPKVALPAVAAYADGLAEASAGRPFWMALQMAPVRPEMGASDRPPTLKEARCMTYMALARGATGLLFYSFNETKWRIERDAPELWEQWALLTRELRDLAPLLLQPVIKEEIRVETLDGPDKPGPWNYPALHLSLRQTPNGYLLIAVNGLNEEVEARMVLPALSDAVQDSATVRFENRKTRLRRNGIRDRFAPYAVHVYELTKRNP